MNSVARLRVTINLFPPILALLALLSGGPGYATATYVVATIGVAIYAASFLTRSDGLHMVSLLMLGALVVFVVSSWGWLLLTFAAVASLLVMTDLTFLASSLIGLTYPRVDLRQGGGAHAYLDMIKRQAVRSAGVGIATFLVSLLVAIPQAPLIAFGNAVSGSGLLALAALLLIALTASEAWMMRRLAGRRPSRSLESADLLLNQAEPRPRLSSSPWIPGRTRLAFTVERVVTKQGTSEALEAERSSVRSER